MLHPVRLAEFSVNFSYSVDSSSGRVPACHSGRPGFDSRTMQFNLWHLERSTGTEYLHYVTVLGLNVYITSQYFFPAIIYRDILYALCTSNTPPAVAVVGGGGPPPTTAIFRNFKKSTAPYKVHNMGLRYIKLTIDTNTQLMPYKALHFSEGPLKIVQILLNYCLKRLFCFAQWMECDQN